jgi:rod shape-determining protein MreD
MRNVGFLSMGLALLILQANVFRLLDDLSVSSALLIWATSVSIDVWRTLRRRPGHPRTLSIVRADLALPATVLLGYALLVSVGHTQTGRPIPALALPLVLFMGVHEYSLARGAAIAFVIGYATDVFGIAPVGLYTFTYVATFLLARAAGVRLAAQTMWMQALLVGIFTILQSTMVLVLLAIFGRDPWVPKCLYPLALPHAIATAAVAPLVFRLAQAVHSMSGGSPRTDIAGVSL